MSFLQHRNEITTRYRQDQGKTNATSSLQTETNYYQTQVSSGFAPKYIRWPRPCVGSSKTVSLTPHFDWQWWIETENVKLRSKIIVMAGVVYDRCGKYHSLKTGQFFYCIRRTVPLLLCQKLIDKYQSFQYPERKTKLSNPVKTKSSKQEF